MTRLLLSLAFAASCAACASILDFQEPTDKVSLSDVEDGGVAPVPSSTSTTDSTPIDAASPADAGSPHDASSKDASADASAPSMCVCVPSVADWQGPFVVARATSGEPPACDGAYPNDVYTGFGGANAPAAQCSCSCGAPANVACSAPATTFFSDASCSTSCTTASDALACAAVASYSCDLLALAKPKAMTVGASTPSGGACAPSANAVIPSQTWARSIRLCGGAKATCDENGCPAAPSPAYGGANRCIMKAGDNTCPAGFPVKEIYHHGGTDTRACTACSCGDPTDVACVANVATFGGATCTGKATATTVTPSGCVPLTAGGRLNVTSAAAQGGSCAPSGGQPIGGFTEDGPTTICCLD